MQRDTCDLQFYAIIILKIYISNNADCFHFFEPIFISSLFKLKIVTLRMNPRLWKSTEKSKTWYGHMRKWLFWMLTHRREHIVIVFKACEKSKYDDTKCPSLYSHWFNCLTELTTKRIPTRLLNSEPEKKRRKKSHKNNKQISKKKYNGIDFILSFVLRMDKYAFIRTSHHFQVLNSGTGLLSSIIIIWRGSNSKTISLEW